MNDNVADAPDTTAGEHLIPAGHFLPEWIGNRPVVVDMVLTLFRDGSFTLHRSLGAAEHR